MSLSESLGNVINDFKSELTSHGLVLIIIGGIINIISSLLINYFRIPLWLDSTGTILVAVLSGPWTSFITGLLTFIILGINDLTIMPFFLISSVLGLIIGYLHKFKVLSKESGFLELLGLCFFSAIISTLIYSPVTIITLWNGTSYSNLLYQILFGSSNGLTNGLFNSLVGVELLSQLLDKTVVIFTVYIILLLIPEEYFHNEKIKKTNVLRVVKKRVKKKNPKKKKKKREKKEYDEIVTEKEIIIEH